MALLEQPRQSTDYRKLFDGFLIKENEKNALIERLVNELENTKLELKRTQLDFDRERSYNRDGQMREERMKMKITKLEIDAGREAYTLALIDGDGMIFQDDLLKQGEDGGKLAAQQLWVALRDHAQRTMPSLLDYKIVVRVYANQRGLAETCVRAGIIDDHRCLDAFVRGFTGSKQLFDFVDVGSGKDRADEKISELFRMNLNNLHCRQILLGCSHDNGYARLLEEVIGSESIGKVTLLEGVPFERELAAAKNYFTSTIFNGLFRTTKISLFPSANKLSQSVQARANSEAANETGYPANGYSLNNGSHESPRVTPASIALNKMPQRSMTGSSAASNGADADGFTVVGTKNATNGKAASSPTQTWAGKALAAASLREPSPPRANSGSNPPQIPRNRQGKRVDQPVRADQQEVKRVSKIKMCNVHYLQHSCPYGSDCTHSHTANPSKAELEVLKVVARSIACRNGTQCDDMVCIHGHRCPHTIEGTKHCFYGAQCRFSQDMHFTDTNVVRTTTIKG